MLLPPCEPKRLFTRAQLACEVRRRFEPRVRAARAAMEACDSMAAWARGIAARPWPPGALVADSDSDEDAGGGGEASRPLEIAAGDSCCLGVGVAAETSTAVPSFASSDKWTPEAAQALFRQISIPDHPQSSITSVDKQEDFNRTALSALEGDVSNEVQNTEAAGTAGAC